jgi:glucose/arabinose dehydrogenase
MRGVRRILATAVLVAFALAVGCSAPNADALSLKAVPIVHGLSSPVFVTSVRGHDGLYIVQQNGVVRLYRDGRLLPTPFLDLRSRVSCCGERGLLSIALDPHFLTNHRLFVSYTNTSGDSRVVAYHTFATNRDRVNPATARVFLGVHQPYPNHNGGQIAFGPDGKLYAGFGDGGSEGDPNLVGQRKTGYLSKIVRMDVSKYPAPKQIYAYGLRNPWRFSFDRLTGALWIGDVGQGSWEEVDWLAKGTTAGTNFGWSYYEGRSVYKRQPIDRSRLVFPVIAYSHANGNCAVTGGYVYRGDAIPWLRGYYLWGDYCSGHVWKRQGPHGTTSATAFSGHIPQISSFGEGPLGGLYIASLNGTIYRIAAA